MTILAETIRCKTVILVLLKTRSGQLEKEMNVQVMKTNSVSSCVNDFVRNNDYFKEDTESRIYMTVMRLILTDWKTSQPKRHVQVTEMRMLSRNVGK